MNYDMMDNEVIIMQIVMSKIELFMLFYYYIEAKNQMNPNQKVTDYLKRADPFRFTDLGSADKRIYVEFDLMIGNSPVIEADYGYYLIIKYLRKKQMPELIQLFSEIAMNEWKEVAKIYLSQPHKGMNG